MDECEESSMAHALDPVEAALAEYFVRLDQGEAIALTEIIAAHPGCESGLRQFLNQELKLRAVAAASLTAVPHGNLVGRTLGDFLLHGELGRGGMGTVFEAEQISMGRRVALKVLPFTALIDDKSLQRFHNEVRAAAALDHPHIVSVYSVGEDRGVHYYAMQFIRGQTLADLIRQLRNDGRVPIPLATVDSLNGANGHTTDTSIGGPPSTQPDERALIGTAADSHPSAEYYRSAARLGIQAAEALQHAHDLGVLHRDIKPSNLMLDGEGKLYITDFGLARIEADVGLTMTGDIIGTLRYMAPEQALAKRVMVDHRADVYSLGATLYELLTLQPIFEETDRSELLKQIAFEEPIPLRKLDRRVPAELETIVLKATAKGPDDRYQSAQRLADDLRAFLENRPIEAKPPTILGLAQKWSRRHKPLVASTILSTATLVLVSLGVLAASNMAITRERNEKAIALNERTAALSRAEANFDMVLAVIARMFDHVGNETIAEVPQMDQLRKDVLDDALGFYEKLLTENPDDKKVQFAAARAYNRVALMEIEFSFGSRLKAIPPSEKAIAILDELLRNDPANQAYRFDLATALKQKCWCDDFEDDRSRATDLYEGLVKDNRDEPKYMNGLVDMLYNSYWAASAKRRSRIVERMLQLAASPHLGKRLLAQVHEAAGHHHDRMGRLEEAEAEYRESIRILKLSLEDHPNDSRGRQFYIAILTEFGELLAERDKSAEAEETLREALRAGEQACSDFPAMVNFRRVTHNAIGSLIDLLTKQGETDLALQELADMPMRDARDYAFHITSCTELGQTELANADYQPLVEQAQRALELDPTISELYEPLFSGLTVLGRRDEALALVRDMDTPDINFVAIRAVLLGKFTSAERTPSDAKAQLELWSRFIEHNPTSVDGFANRSRAYFKQGKYNEALLDADKATELEPRYASAWNIRGMAYSSIGQNDKAIECYNEAIRLDNDIGAFWANRSQAYRALRRFDEALKDVTEGIRLDPDAAAQWSSRGHIFFDSKKFDKAVEDYSKAILLKPESGFLWSNRGASFRELRQYDKALEDYNEAIRRDPSNAEIWQNRGAVYAKMKQFDDAVEDFNEAIRLEPASAVYLNNRGFSFSGLRRYSEAIDDFEAAIAINENLWQSKKNLAWLLATADKEEFRDGQRALDLAQSTYEADDFGNSGEANLLHVLAAAHAEVGDFDKAAECSQKAIEMVSEFEKDEEWANELSAQLESYQAGRPWRIKVDAASD